jgi:hypothetical protein
VVTLIGNGELRRRVSDRAQALAAKYSWRRCARETWSFLVETCTMVGRGSHGGDGSAARRQASVEAEVSPQPRR